VGSGSAGAQNVRTIVNVGVGLALGVLMDTFLVRTLLVPSAVVLIGRWNWWPSALYRARPAAAEEDATKSAREGAQEGAEEGAQEGAQEGAL